MFPLSLSLSPSLPLSLSPSLSLIAVFLHEVAITQSQFPLVSTYHFVSRLSLSILSQPRVLC
jgi:hypothetical protein